MGSAQSGHSEASAGDRRTVFGTDQIAVSNHMFDEDMGVEDLTCMNCLRVEMGERGCYTGICDMCGQVPPSLRWKYPELDRQKREEAAQSRRARSQWMRAGQRAAGGGRMHEVVQQAVRSQREGNQGEGTSRPEEGTMTGPEDGKKNENPRQGE